MPVCTGLICKKVPGCEAARRETAREGRRELIRFALRDLELQSEHDLTLPVGSVGTSTGDSTKVSIVDLIVRPVEDRPIEGVEVIHLQNARESFAEVELLSGIEVFVVERRVPEF